jgi:phosphatidylserine/phosphatidylglycerophosphate/cardiolipin synthase-like enzyme
VPEAIQETHGRRIVIIPANGVAVRELLDKAARVPERYRQVVVSAPFLDDVGRALLDRVRRGTTAANRRLLVAVPERNGAPPFSLTGLPPRNVEVRYVPRLHAKVYVLVGMDPRDNEAIVTSANLTEPGLFRNLEVGIQIRGQDRHLQRVIERVATLASN